MDKHTNRGFTIVELLIVIVVIAILAAISIVAYNGIQNRANDTTVRSDIAAVRTKLEIAKIDLTHYPQSYSEFPDFKFTKSAYNQTQNNVYYITNTATDTYALGLRSKSSTGFILTDKAIYEDEAISAQATAGKIGIDWFDAGTYKVQGYTSTTGTWNSSFPWTN